MSARTLFEKIWDRHVIAEEDGELLLYVDRALFQQADVFCAALGVAGNDIECCFGFIDRVGGGATERLRISPFSAWASCIGT